MPANIVIPELDTTYLEKFKAKFTGLVRWADLDAFIPHLKKQTGSEWYIYDLTKPPPDTPVNATEFQIFISYIDGWLRETHKEDFCGLVYVDNRITPGFIKIYHPENMGHGTCSISKTCPLPGWVLSTIKPTDLNPKQSKTSWWKHFPYLK